MSNSRVLSSERIDSLDPDSTCRVCGQRFLHHPTCEWNHAETVTPFESWWLSTVASDIERTVPKVAEYGTRDLAAMGMALLEGKGALPDPGQFHAITSIYGCMFYIIGKAMRAIAALERGEMPSEDTLFDLAIYAMMARGFQDRGEL